MNYFFKDSKESVVVTRAIRCKLPNIPPFHVKCRFRNFHTN